VDFADPTAGQVVGHDAKGAISDWSQIDGVLKHFPDPHYKKALPPAPVSDDGRYRIGAWWFCLFERHWQLRGMTNALMDYYTDPDSVHRLFRKLTDFYLVWLERASREQRCDAIMTSDDIGTQTGPFFSVEIVREFFKPYYKELIDRAHSLGMHFWLHACGCIEKFLPELVELGLDVIHPIQKYTMDERKIAREFGGKITFWAGFDVQRIIPWGSPDEVRREVRFMLDTYARPEGRLIFTAGNGVNGDCTLESLQALFDEAFTYGEEVVKKP
jgi:uroporphyrinogen-III decarboxylase